MNLENLVDINDFLKSKKEAYNILINNYPPSIDSKAINKEYLQKFMLEGSQILNIERAKMANIFVVKQRHVYSNDEFLEKLELMLYKKNLPQTIFTPGCKPDTEWLLKVIKMVDPQDAMQIFISGQSFESTIKHNLDPVQFFIKICFLEKKFL